MPELPEVETIVRGLSRALTGRKLARVETFRPDLRAPFPKNLSALQGRKVISAARRAKYILIHLAGGQTLLLHLGMSGRLLIRPKSEKQPLQKHDHLRLTLDNGTEIVFNDARRFGRVDLAPTGELDKHALFAHLGPDPFDKKFNAAYLAEKLHGKKAAIKLIILDQKFVVGVGNIYAAEALFYAGIDPRRAGGDLTAAECGKLAHAIRRVLKAAIAAGGSSLRDYVQTDGELGYFQHKWAVYDKAGQNCPGCTCQKRRGKRGIQRLIQGGRSTFYCPVKQK